MDMIRLASETDDKVSSGSSGIGGYRLRSRGGGGGGGDASGRCCGGYSGDCSGNKQKNKVNKTKIVSKVSMSWRKTTAAPAALHLHRNYSSCNGSNNNNNNISSKRSNMTHTNKRQDCIRTSAAELDKDSRQEEERVETDNDSCHDECQGTDKVKWAHQGPETTNRYCLSGEATARRQASLAAAVRARRDDSSTGPGEVIGTAAEATAAQLTLSASAEAVIKNGHRYWWPAENNPNPTNRFCNDQNNSLCSGDRPYEQAPATRLLLDRSSKGKGKRSSRAVLQSRGITQNTALLRKLVRRHLRPLEDGKQKWDSNDRNKFSRTNSCLMVGAKHHFVAQHGSQMHQSDADSAQRSRRLCRSKIVCGVLLALLAGETRTIVNFASAKGLVGKLPGNPASCPEEPCNSDPQHVLYALKWTSLGFACCLLLPLLMYGLSKLFSKMRAMCTDQKSDGDEENSKDLGKNSSTKSGSYSDYGNNYALGEYDDDDEDGSGGSGDDGDDDSAEMAVVGANEKRFCDTNSKNNNNNNNNLNRNLKQGSRNINYNNYNYNKKHSLAAQVGNNVNNQVYLHQQAQQTKASAKHQHKGCRGSIDGSGAGRAPGKAARQGTPPDAVTSAAFSQQQQPMMQSYRITRGGSGGRRVYPAPQQQQQQQQQQHRPELPLLDPLVVTGGYGDDSGGTANTGNNNNSINGRAASGHKEQQQQQAQCQAAAVAPKSVGQSSRRKSMAVPGMIVAAQQEHHYTNQAPKASGPEVVVAAAAAPTPATADVAKSPRYIDGCAVDMGQRRDTLALPSDESAFGPQHRHSIDGSILSTMVLAMQMQQQHHQQMDDAKRHQQTGWTNSGNYHQQQQLEHELAVGFEEPFAQTTRSIAGAVQAGGGGGSGRKRRLAVAEQRELHARHRRQLREYKEQIERRLWLEPSLQADPSSDGNDKQVEVDQQQQQQRQGDLLIGRDEDDNLEANNGVDDNDWRRLSSAINCFDDSNQQQQQQLNGTATAANNKTRSRQRQQQQQYGPAANLSKVAIDVTSPSGPLLRPNECGGAARAADRRPSLNAAALRHAAQQQQQQQRLFGGGHLDQYHLNNNHHLNNQRL